MMMLTLKRGITYGPVQSRRLGRSLGINILPAGKKTCTLNCVYCQYGWTPYSSLDEMADVPWPSPEEVLHRVAQTLERTSPPPAYITFSGNGEPTLHPEFPAIVEGVIDLRNRLSPGSKTAILTNSTVIDREEVRAALAKLDVRILKLDAGNTETYHNYNKPLCMRDLEQLVTLLQTLNDVTVQSLFTSGDAGNLDPLHVDDWILKVVRVSPVHVQLYTLDRPYPSKKISPASPQTLEEIRGRLEKHGISAAVY